jgi:hypothetical protein
MSQKCFLRQKTLHVPGLKCTFFGNFLVLHYRFEAGKNILKRILCQSTHTYFFINIYIYTMPIKNWKCFCSSFGSRAYNPITKNILFQAYHSSIHSGGAKFREYLKITSYEVHVKTIIFTASTVNGAICAPSHSKPVIFFRYRFLPSFSNTKF